MFEKITQKISSRLFLMALAALASCGLPASTNEPVTGVTGGGGAKEFWVGLKSWDEPVTNDPRWTIRQTNWYDGTSGTSSASYRGTDVVDEKCVADPDSATDRDIFCVIHADELDLNFGQDRTKLNLAVNAHADKCEYLSRYPSFYWNLPGGSGPSSVIYTVTADNVEVPGYTYVDGVLRTSGETITTVNASKEVTSASAEFSGVNGHQVHVTALAGTTATDGTNTLAADRYYWLGYTFTTATGSSSITFNAHAFVVGDTVTVRKIYNTRATNGIDRLQVGLSYKVKSVTANTIVLYSASDLAQTAFTFTGTGWIFLSHPTKAALSEKPGDTAYTFTGAGTLTFSTTNKGGVTFDADGNPVCPWNYKSTMGDDYPNCCVGSYNQTKTALEESQAIPASSVSVATDKIKWEGHGLTSGDRLMILSSASTDLTQYSIYTVSIPDNSAVPPTPDPDYFQIDDGAGGVVDITSSGALIVAKLPDAPENSTPDWQGDLSGCLKGPGTINGEKTASGYPVPTIFAVRSENRTEYYDVLSEKESQIDPYSFELANFMPGISDPDDPYQWATAFRPPADVANHTDANRGVAGGMELEEWGAIDLQANPFFTFECLNRDQEVLARIRVAVQEWNTKEELSKFIDDGDTTANPDIYPNWEDDLEPNFPYSAYNDAADFEDLEVRYSLPVFWGGLNIFGDSNLESYPGVIYGTGSIGGLSVDRAPSADLFSILESPMDPRWLKRRVDQVVDSRVRSWRDKLEQTERYRKIAGRRRY